MATKVQLARAASALRSTAEVYRGSAAALQELLQTLSSETNTTVDAAVPAYPADSAPHTALEQQQVRPTTDTQQDDPSVVTRQSAPWGHIRGLQHGYQCQSAVSASQHAVALQVQAQQVLQQQVPVHGLHSHLAAVTWHRQHIDTSPSSLCEYNSIPPNKGDSGASTSNSSDSSTNKQSGRTASSDSQTSLTKDSLAAALLALANSSKTAKLTPSAITKELDKHIVGQAVRGDFAVWLSQKPTCTGHHLFKQSSPRHVLAPCSCGVQSDKSCMASHE